MYYGKDPKNFQHMVGLQIEKLLFLQNPQEICPYMPDTLHIEPIGVCNLDCIHCVRSKITRKQGRMTFEQYKNIIDKVAKYRPNISIGRNGEPTLHKQLPEMVKYAKEKGLFVSLITNATMLTPQLSKKLIKAGLDRMVFSFDSVDKEVYEKIRIKAKFDVVLKNILYFLKENYEEGLPCHASVSWTTTEEAKRSPTNISGYFMKFPINGVYPSKLLNMFGDTKVDGQFGEDLGKVLSKKKWPVCINGWDRLGIQWNGTVVACVVDFDDRYVIGNIFEQGLEDVWNGRKMRAFRRSLINRDYGAVEKNGELCSNCSAKWEPGMDSRDIVKTTKDLFFKEIYSRERDTKHDDEKRYNNLLKEIKSRGWM